jgi:hypothetical protein
VIWLRRGNRSTAEIEALPRQNRLALDAFAIDASACLELY